jgi:LAS superfamily LD-carboxypeptidase LdcB
VPAFFFCAGPCGNADFFLLPACVSAPAFYLSTDFFLRQAQGLECRMLDELELTGRAASHVVQRDDLGAAVHRDALAPFLAMKAAAADAGIELEIASGFRDFSAQQRIWNMKYRGERPLYDAAGIPRDHASLSPAELVDSILCWSALPGASRHHWGTDIDVVDRAAMPEGYRYRLVPEEYAAGGVFHTLNLWLAANIARFGFYRPYANYNGGVHPEPWHLSYAPVATRALQLLTPELLTAAVRESDMLGKNEVLARLPDIYRTYVMNIAAAPPESPLRETT